MFREEVIMNNMPKLGVILKEITNNPIEPIKDKPKCIDYVFLPGNLKTMIDVYSDVYGCPKEFIIAGMYQAVALIIGKKLATCTDKYINYPLLWIGIVAPSGTNKSAPIRQILEPLKKIDSLNIL